MNAIESIGGSTAIGARRLQPFTLPPRKGIGPVATACGVAACLLGVPMLIDATTGAVPENPVPVVLGEDTPAERPITISGEQLECTEDPEALLPGGYICPAGDLSLRVTDQTENPEKVLRRMHRAVVAIPGAQAELVDLGDTLALKSATTHRISFITPVEAEGESFLAFASFLPTTDQPEAHELFDALFNAVTSSPPPPELYADPGEAEEPRRIPQPPRTPMENRL